MNFHGCMHAHVVSVHPKFHRGSSKTWAAVPSKAAEDIAEEQSPSLQVWVDGFCCCFCLNTSASAGFIVDVAVFVFLWEGCGSEKLERHSHLRPRKKSRKNNRHLCNFEWTELVFSLLDWLLLSLLLMLLVSKLLVISWFCCCVLMLFGYRCLCCFDRCIRLPVASVDNLVLSRRGRKNSLWMHVAFVVT